MSIEKFLNSKLLNEAKNMIRLDEYTVFVQLGSMANGIWSTYSKAEAQKIADFLEKRSYRSDISPKIYIEKSSLGGYADEKEIEKLKKALPDIKINEKD
jgi:hypothetical protein